MMTATQAAKDLGVSRKTYYKWEQRGLAALLEGLQDQPAGRPETPEEVSRQEEFNKQLSDLKREKELLEKKMKLKDLVHQMELKAKQNREEKK
jgi:transposase